MILFNKSLGPVVVAPAVFSDSYEQALLRQYFKHVTTGSFVDVGANDPSNAVSRFLWGTWHGIIVEPLPEQASKFRGVAGLVVAEVALTSAENAFDGSASFSVAGKQSTLMPDKLMDKSVIDHIVEVRTATLEQILIENKRPKIDFLSVDVEGAELEVLADFDLERYEVDLLLVEDWGRDFRLHRLLKKKGYKRVRRTGFNSWYVPINKVFPISILGRLQLFKKYVLGLPFRRLRKWRHDRRYHRSANTAEK